MKIKKYFIRVHICCRTVKNVEYVKIVNILLNVVKVINMKKLYRVRYIDEDGEEYSHTLGYFTKESFKKYIKKENEWRKPEGETILKFNEYDFEEVDMSDLFV